MAGKRKQSLWGGAITTEIPEGLLDASDFRQVPDTQEVFVPGAEADDTSLTGVRVNDSIIFDLMERIDQEDSEAIKEHLAEISNLNGTKDWELFEITKCSNKLGVKAYICVALEPALKWGRKEHNNQHVNKAEYKPALALVLGVVRLEKVSTDLLVTYNAHFGDVDELEQLEQLHHAQDEEHMAQNVAYKRITFASGVVESIIKELQVEDWKLFG